MAQFQIETAANGQYYFRLKATGNNKNILHSEMYTTKSACRNGIDSVKKNAPDDVRYARLTARNGTFYFNLKAANGEVIGTSGMYSTEAVRDQGIEFVKAEAPTASVIDLS